MTITELRIPPTLPPDLAADLLATGSAIDPYPTYHRLRSDFPVAEFLDAVSLFRYDDVAELLRHTQVSTDDRNSTLHRSQVADDKLAPAYLSQLDDQSFLHRDPPEHTRLRKLVAKGFTARRIAALRPFVQHTVDAAIDTAEGEGRLELVSALAYPLPVEVICELLGIPAEDRPFVASWPRTQLCCSFESGSLAAANKTNTRQVEADRIQQQLTDYFGMLIERRRTAPGDDLISALLTAQEHGDRLSVEEINATLRLLFVAGYENAVNLIGHGVLALLCHPDQWTALRDNPTLTASAVDEVLRYDGPFQFVRRVALADLDIGGYHIPRGQHVIAWLAAANRDPARFPNPDRFDIRRGDNHPDHRHLAFGSGIHACLGGPLARMEAEIVFATLARRLAEPRLAADQPHYRTDVFRSLAELPIIVRDTRDAA
ncbi:cytochrome P450 [Amycolatopsis echigonensis]|uniref:Cytochrome P450 n=1 Tax=Amycolatopsis echigonensis TaxID=2576905 RepID=A0A8E2B6U9_9PSEU|nr:cytochrome P450 [Amycolatopsis echigonensis]MBB2504044.1 cytochrome P450 [Amycolatopsis echigonensis]